MSTRASNLTPRAKAASATQRQRRIKLHAWSAIDSLIERGAMTYCRQRDIPRLLPILASEISLEDVRQGSAQARQIINRLKRALRQERTLGRSGHWTYNLARHMSLTQALKAEMQYTS